MNDHPGHYVLFGDFNAVRFESERISSQFNSTAADSFIHFIHDGDLGEIPLGGNSFTRLSTSGDKLSKLDRFLISNDYLSHFEHYRASTIDCTVSDHRLIILKRVFVDFDPISFKLYNSWLNQTPVVDLVVTVWKQFQSCSGGSSFVIFKNFLKKVQELKDIDDALEAGSGCPSVYQQRLSLLHQIKELEQ
ncbi:RNA-directed DNA polymerase, eukaryota, reverse transcriptase zinc-binding domain protein [Tanacetum coccineum]